MLVPKVGNSISSVGQLASRAARLAGRMSFDFEEAIGQFGAIFFDEFLKLLEFSDRRPEDKFGPHRQGWRRHAEPVLASRRDR